MEKILEPQIKAAFINKAFNDKKPEDQIILNEFNIENSTRRVDLVVISKNMIEAFEIKSEADSLKRLEGQIKKYSEYFDKVTVILAKKHKSKACELLGKDIGIWEFEENNLKVIKKGRKKIIKNKENIMKLMTAYELKNLSKSLDMKTTFYKRKDLELLLSKYPTETIREAAIKALEERYKKRYVNFLETISGKNVKQEDLYLLSSHKKPYRDQEKPSISDLTKSLEFISP